MYEVTIIKMYDKNKVERQTHDLVDVDEFRKEIESLRWKYSKNYLSRLEYFQTDISEDALHVELWYKNKHSDIWKGAGDYFFLQNNELENEIKEIIKNQL